MVSNEGAQIILSALRSAYSNGLWLALYDVDAVISRLTTLATFQDIVPASGSYSRQNCSQANISVADGVMTLVGTFRFVGFTTSRPIAGAALVTVGSGVGTLISWGAASTSARDIIDVGQPFDLVDPTFRL